MGKGCQGGEYQGRLERFGPDLPADPGQIATGTAGTALRGDAESSLPWPGHVASSRLVHAAIRLGPDLDQAGQGETALAVPFGTC